MPFTSRFTPRSRVALATLGEKSYDDIVKAMSEHHEPPSEITQCFKFHTRSRTSGESIAAYVAALCTLGKTFVFENSLEDKLRARLVCGVNDDEIQRQLLGVTDTKLDFKKALELVVSMKAANKNTCELQNCAGTGSGRSPL